MTFDTDGQGNLIVSPLMSFDVVTYFGTTVVIRLGCAASEADQTSGRLTNYQISATPEQARVVGRALIDAAERLLQTDDIPRPS